MKVQININNIVIVGLEKDVVSLALSQNNRFKILGYTDTVDRKVKIPYLGNDLEYLGNSPEPCGIILPIDKPEIRHKLEKLYRKYNFYFPSLISDDAVINELDIYNREGLIIQSSVYISSDVKIGNFVKLNVGAKVFHDSSIGDYSTLSPGATILGSSTVGTHCYIGSNSTIRNGVSINNGITIGFGSVVTKSLTNKSGFTYVGNPAYPL